MALQFMEPVLGGGHVITGVALHGQVVLSPDELRQIVEYGNGRLAWNEDAPSTPEMAMNRSDQPAEPPRITALDLAAAAIQEQRERHTGVAESLDDIAGLIGMLLELFQDCGGGAGEPPRPAESFLRSVRNPTTAERRMHVAAALREAEHRVGPKPRGGGGRVRRWRQSVKHEHSLVYWSQVDALADATDEQLLAMRDDIIAREAG